MRHGDHALLIAFEQHHVVAPYLVDDLKHLRAHFGDLGAHFDVVGIQPGPPEFGVRFDDREADSATIQLVVVRNP